jgi:DNA-binding CsgD family transcriptional regulator
MLRLSCRDQRAVLDCLRTTYATLDLEAFPRQVVAGLRRVVPAPFGSYNEIDHRAARIRYVVEPAEAQVPHLELVVRQYLHEQPVVAHYRRTGDGSPRKLSDFLTQDEFHRLGIYNENYRRTGVEHQMTFMVESLQRPSSSTIAIALDRGRADSDFTERDRAILKLVRPHLMTAYGNAETVSALRRTAPNQRRARDPPARDHRATTKWSTPHVSTCRPLAAPVLPGWLVAGRALPDDLKRWIRRQTVCLGRDDTVSGPPRPLLVEGKNTRLSVRLIPDSPDDLLILEEERMTPDYAALQRFGLTLREAEVLHWVAEGKSNHDIGTILHANPRTVAKHVERIMAKLGVETRTAAAIRARTDA